MTIELVIEENELDNYPLCNTELGGHKQFCKAYVYVSSTVMFYTKYSHDNGMPMDVYRNDALLLELPYNTSLDDINMIYDVIVEALGGLSVEDKLADDRKNDLGSLVDAIDDAIDDADESMTIYLEFEDTYVCSADLIEAVVEHKATNVKDLVESLNEDNIGVDYCVVNALTEEKLRDILIDAIDQDDLSIVTWPVYLKELVK